MDRTEKIELTTAVLVKDPDGRILLEDRQNTDWPGLFFPGGHVEPGESVVHGAIRELWEETGLTIENPRLCGLKQFPLDEGGRYLVLFFKADRYSGELHGSEEGPVFWVAPEDLPNYRLSGNFMETLRVFEDEDINEFYCHWQGDTFVRELV